VAGRALLWFVANLLVVGAIRLVGSRTFHVWLRINAQVPTTVHFPLGARLQKMTKRFTFVMSQTVALLYRSAPIFQKLSPVLGFQHSRKKQYVANARIYFEIPFVHLLETTAM